MIVILPALPEPENGNDIPSCPDCDGVNTAELNLSINVSQGDGSGNYGGYTEYGDCDVFLGVYCLDCDKEFYSDAALRTTIRSHFIDGRPYTIENRVPGALVQTITGGTP